jgi:hypothetical protein
MSSTNLTNSPSRGTSQAKRKMPDTNVYKPPVLKTHLISESQMSPKHHTPSPVSATAISNHTSSFSFDDTNKPVVTAPITASQFQPHLHQPPHLMRPNFPNLVSNHVKTFSLPVDMHQAQVPFMPNHIYQQPGHVHGLNTMPAHMAPHQQQHQFQPPVRSFNPNGDIPLPNGWSCERSATGQFYYLK